MACVVEKYVQQSVLNSVIQNFISMLSSQNTTPMPKLHLPR